MYLKIDKSSTSNGYKKIMEYLDKSRMASDISENKYNKANVHECLGDIAVTKGDAEMENGTIKIALSLYKNADSEYIKSQNLFLEVGNGFNASRSKYRLGRLHRKLAKIEKGKEHIEKAVTYLKSALDIATEDNEALNIRDVSKELYEIYGIDKKNPSIEMKYLKLLHTKNEFLKKNEMSKLKSFFDFEKEKEKEKFIRTLWISAFFGLVILLVISQVYSGKLAKQKKELEKSYKDIERMSEIGQVITSTLSQKEIYNRVYEHVKDLMDADVFLIFTYNETLNRLVYSGGKEENLKDPNEYFDLTEKNRPAVKCFLEQKPLIFKNYPKEYRDAFGEEKPEPKKGQSFISHIFLPLVIENEREKKTKKIGVLTVQCSKESAYDDYHVNILKSIGSHAAIALDNANAYRQIEEHKELIEKQIESIKEKTRLEEELKKEKEISEHKDDLMHTLSHQYKTPISIINTSAQLLKNYLTKMSKNEIEDEYEKIFSNVHRMEQLIDNILNPSKPFNPGYHDLYSLCKSAVEEVRSNRSSNHEIMFKSSGVCNQIYIDKDQMSTTVQILIDNAIKYSPKSGEINFVLNCRKEDIIIKISDQGIGIPEDYLNKPFERFRRGSNAATIPGTGLGLSIVKRYVDLHKGKIEIESELNVGTTITITIPKK